MKLLAIAQITKPHGIKGEVRATVLLDSPELFCRIKTVILDGQEVKVLCSRTADAGAAILRLDGCADRDAAESLRGKTLYIPRENAESLKNGRFFIDDLVGLCAYAGQTSVGKVTDVIKGGRAADVIVIRLQNGKDVMLPFLTRLNAKVDNDLGRITFDEQAFSEVSVYED